MMRVVNEQKKVESEERVSAYVNALCIYLLCLPLGALNLSPVLGSLLRYIAILPLAFWLLTLPGQRKLNFPV